MILTVKTHKEQIVLILLNKELTLSNKKEKGCVEDKPVGEVGEHGTEEDMNV